MTKIYIFRFPEISIDAIKLKEVLSDFPKGEPSIEFKEKMRMQAIGKRKEINATIIKKFINE